MARSAARAGTVRTLAVVVSAAALATVAGCSGSSGGSGGSAGTGVAAGAAPTTAPPGKYRTLPEPCGSVSTTTLHALLPASGDYAGTALPTYDTDRRVGCHWTGTAQGADRELSVDFERVVSYDPAVSDEQKAQQDFAERAAAAHIPDNSPLPNDSAAVPSPGQSVSAEQDSGGDTSPRRVGGVGDEAYLDDVVVPAGNGTRRNVTMVFREANVLVTVEFDQWSDISATPPSSVELQLGAHGLAQELAKVIAR
jgi:hypothetical protein